MPRSHAARTCTACKRGKRRCELPTSSQRLEGGVPLAPSDACARCRRLKSVCVLDGTYRYAHLHTLTPSSASTGPDETTPNGKAQNPFMTHPRSLDEYEGYFPRFLPLSLMREFHRQALESYRPPPIRDPPPESILDDVVTEEYAQEAAAW